MWSGTMVRSVCDIAEEELAELLAWREAVAMAEAAQRALRSVPTSAELRREIAAAETAVAGS
jgi:hypothetical protein